jgi:hypothetical protein
MSAAAAAAASRRADAVGIARGNIQRFWALVDAPDDEFKAKTKHSATLAAVLGISETDVAAPVSKNHSMGLKAVRKLFRSYPWLSRDKVKVVPFLLAGDVICTPCFGYSASIGTMKAIPTSVADHGTSRQHLARAGVEAAAQRFGATRR